MNDDKPDILDKIRHAQALCDADEHEAELYPRRATYLLVEARDEIVRLREEMRDRELRDALGDMSKLGGF